MTRAVGSGLGPIRLTRDRLSELGTVYFSPAFAALLDVLLKWSSINTALPPTRIKATTATVHQTFHMATGRSGAESIGLDMGVSLWLLLSPASNLRTAILILA
jgi:hypothetical protein